jgi:hypothetical protein
MWAHETHFISLSITFFVRVAVDLASVSATARRIWATVSRPLFEEFLDYDLFR